MNWIKDSVEDSRITGLIGFAIVLFIVSIYVNSKLVFFLAAFLLLIMIVNHFYLKRSGNRLSFEDTSEKGHFFIDESGKWTLHFRNEGLPILKGELRVYFDQYVTPVGSSEDDQSLSLHEISIPFSIWSYQTKQISIPFKAQKRGIAKIRQFDISIPSVIGFGEILLKYQSLINQEAVIYPRPIPVKGLKELVSVQQGENAVPYSVYEDRLGPIGTRDYVASDSFNRIHWKASTPETILTNKSI